MLIICPKCDHEFKFNLVETLEQISYKQSQDLMMSTTEARCSTHRAHRAELNAASLEAALNGARKHILELTDKLDASKLACEFLSRFDDPQPLSPEEHYLNSRDAKDFIAEIRRTSKP